MATREDYLELTSPGEPARRIPLGKARVQFGRSIEADLQLPGAYVSRRHARLERGPEGQWRVIDLGSSNGTFVNNRRVEVAALNAGDVIGIGPHRLTLHVRAEGSATSLTAPDAEIVPSDLASVVVDRPELRGDRVVPARVLSSLHEAGRRLSRLADIPSLLAALAQDFRSLLRPKRIAVGREDGPECCWPVVTDGRGEPLDGSDLPRLLVPRVHALEGSIAVKLEALLDTNATTTARRASGSLLFPIKAGARRLGHIYVELAPARRAPGEETIEFLSLLARQAALVWENLELQDARREADELNRELSAARQIQLQLFPRSVPLDPRIEIAAENIPALGVSGDYYDFQLLEPGRILFILADVMGHGLPAALLMASVQAVFRTSVRAGWTLEHLDHHLNDLVSAAGEGETFVSGLLGLCDLTARSLALLCAGHPWPSICCETDVIRRDEKACSFPWGVFAERQLAPARLEMPGAGWSLVAFTDGLPETPLPGGGAYGMPRLREVHRNCRASSADEICEQILSDVIRASDDSLPQHDDFTLLVLRGAAHA